MTKNKINLRQNSTQILLSNNIPITKPRILVLEILLKNEGPLKVEEVIKLSKGKLINSTSESPSIILKSSSFWKRWE